MSRSMIKGHFGDRQIQALCDCEQKRNATTARNALGPFPDEYILSGIDKVLCFFGISDIYEWMGQYPMLNDCSFLSTKSLSSLSEVDLEYAPYKCECLYLNNNMSKSPSSGSEFEFLSAHSNLEIGEAQLTCPPCKELTCKRPQSLKKSATICEPTQTSLRLMCPNFLLKGKKAPQRTVSKLGNAGSLEKCSIKNNPEKYSLNLCPPPKKKCTCTPMRKRPPSTSSEKSSGSFSFKITCRPTSPYSPRKPEDFIKLPTINSSSLSKETESLDTKMQPKNINSSDKKKLPLKIDPRPKIVDTKWALARVNVFDDCSKTYEIMDLKKKIPKGSSAGKTQLFFAVLPDGTTCSYDCLGEVKTK